MPGELDGLALLRGIKERGLDIEVVVVTAFATQETAIAAMKQGAAASARATRARWRSPTSATPSSSALENQAAGAWELPEHVEVIKFAVHWSEAMGPDDEAEAVPARRGTGTGGQRVGRCAFAPQRNSSATGTTTSGSSSGRSSAGGETTIGSWPSR